MRRLSEGVYPSLLWAVIIMILMGLPGSYFPAVVTFWDWLGPDKIIHLLVFGILSFLFLYGYRKDIVVKDSRYRCVMYVVSLVFSISYGGMTELLQKHLFINRFGSVLDFFADAIGCVIGLVIFVLCFEKKIKKNTNL